MKTKGVTMIELLLTVAVIAFVLVVVAGGVVAANTSHVTFGINGMTEVRCINGYQFVIGHGGQARQVLDEFGKGAKCQQ